MKLRGREKLCGTHILSVNFTTGKSPGLPNSCAQTNWDTARNNYFTEMCSNSEAGSYLRLIDLYHSTLGLRVIKKKKGHS